MSEVVTIADLGHSGDGIAETSSGRAFVPFTLPGETVRAEIDGQRGTLLEVLRPSPDRVAPPCPHFGSCGGCSLQHMRAEAYLRWKEDQVRAAFAQQGLSPEIRPIVPCPPSSRRRAVFTAERHGKDVVLGFNRMASNEVFAVPECHVLLPAIVGALPAIRGLVAPLVQPGRRARIAVVAADNGLDVAIDGLGKVDRHTIEALPGRAAGGPVLRLAIAGEIAFRAGEPTIRSGDAVLLPVPGGFIQAVRSAEDAMAAVAAEGVEDATSVLDLFAGIGTFTFRLARRAKVTAMEGDAPAVAALMAAMRRNQGIKAVTAERRDLFRDPPGQAELRGIGAVVFDPPRSGAREVAEALALSKVPRVVAISCNPATLARDARILVDGGYRLAAVQPVDQFLWSPHIEAVALFDRPRR